MEPVEEALEQPKRRAKRITGKAGAAGKSKTVAVDEEAYVQVSQCAKKLKMSKTKFASAAIEFFAKSGLNPTKETQASLGAIGQKVEGSTTELRAHNADIGNRLYGLVRGFERALYTFQQQQQLTTYTYLELIESNILRHLTSLESGLLTPMLEQVMRSKFESLASRIIEERSYLKVMGKPEAEWTAMHKRVNADRDQMLVADLREHIGKYKVPVPRPTTKPAATPAPAKPTPAPTNPAAATPPKP